MKLSGKAIQLQIQPQQVNISVIQIYAPSSHHVDEEIEQRYTEI